jgi:hypothetical protein
MQSGTRTPKVEPIPVHPELTSPSAPASLDSLMKALEVIRIQNETIRQEAADRETKLRQEIATLRNASARNFPSNTQELLDYTASEFQSLCNDPSILDQSYVNSWKNAANFYRLTGNLRESISKGASGDTPDIKQLEITPLVDAITKAIKGAKTSKIDKDKHCEKCGRDGHVKAKCYAKTHSDGSKLS